ncbi:hypothetical protein L2E82_16153 [Cichorium intybus]|uniref:Uncharacterized protein n=1 Tax=Cichorium intybus TaxID=13427 RepID=A0ACB9F434_CICIN|nr:hypothetical protein L2E82_16153 [Cichorium intybus]
MPLLFLALSASRRRRYRNPSRQKPFMYLQVYMGMTMNVDSDFSRSFVLYFSYGLLDAIFQIMVYYVIGGLAHDSAILSRYVEFYKGGAEGNENDEDVGGVSSVQTSDVPFIFSEAIFCTTVQSPPSPPPSIVVSFDLRTVASPIADVLLPVCRCR